jgi:transposase-like protein
MSELKNCPFCDSEIITRWDSDLQKERMGVSTNGTNFEHYFCNKCQYDLTFGFTRSQVKTRERWNTRSQKSEATND